MARYGYSGKISRVDLTSRVITVEQIDEQFARKYVGGSGFGAKYLYDEVAPDVEWDSPENRLILAPGPLGGTTIAGSGTYSVVSKGPMTNLAGASQANGNFGAFLKLSGFDGLIVQGKSPGWVYLVVNDGSAEIREATSLEGKTLWIRNGR